MWYKGVDVFMLYLLHAVRNCDNSNIYRQRQKIVHVSVAVRALHTSLI